MKQVNELPVPAWPVTTKKIVKNLLSYCQVKYQIMITSYINTHDRQDFMWKDYLK